MTQSYGTIYSWIYINVQSVPITTKVVCSIPAHGMEYATSKDSTIVTRSRYSNSCFQHS